MELNLPERRYYGIGELAKAFQVNTSLIRFWEKEFKELKPKKNANGNRRFTQSDLEVLKRIFHLVKEEGYTLEGAKTHMRDKKKSQEKDASAVLGRLKAIKLRLLEIRDEL